MNYRRSACGTRSIAAFTPPTFRVQKLFTRHLPMLVLCACPAIACAFPAEEILLGNELPAIWLLLAGKITLCSLIALGSARARTRAALESGIAQATDLQAENAKLFRQMQSRIQELMARDKKLEEARTAVDQLREEHTDFLSISGHRMRKPLETLLNTLNLMARGSSGESLQLVEAAIGQCRILRSGVEDIQRAGQVNPQANSIPSMQEAAQRKLEILLVENDSHPSLRARLEGYGHQVRRETNGVDGADAALRGKYDLVLMDVRLPLIDGVESARKIRGDYVNNDLAIIGLISDLRAGDKERYLSKGLTGILPRPVSDTQLMQLLVWAEQKSKAQTADIKPAKASKVLNASTLSRQRDTLGHLAFSELLGERLNTLPKKITAFTSALTGRHWLDAQQQAQAIAGDAEGVGLEVVAARLQALAARLSIDGERDYCRHQRTEILGLMRNSIQQLKAWREQNVHTEWALR